MTRLCSLTTRDDDFFDMAAILLTGIAMNERRKHGGRKVIRRKLFDDYSTDDESTAMACPFSGTTSPSAATTPAPSKLAMVPQSTAFPRRSAAARKISRRPRTRGLVACAGDKESVPVMDLPPGEAPMTRRQKRKARMQAKQKVQKAQPGGNSAEVEAGTEDGLNPAGPATRREAKPNPKYLGPEWVR
ncbi:hypothetical protein C2845_PM15G07900 [Panicum miliaceum]|uniref:Uncharacterized protein n=1 Tax=Panicum miliaceum TaxID=4540 RepID=A0A3L6Q960_PANMI|nr:hypothetical protein C2845_PM15G07900 [Panicum miliaceum]